MGGIFSGKGYPQNSLLGDLAGTAFEEDFVATGFGMHLGMPDLSAMCHGQADKLDMFDFTKRGWDSMGILESAVP
jgi:hypothetical protein